MVKASRLNNWKQRRLRKQRESRKTEQESEKRKSCRLYVYENNIAKDVVANSDNLFKAFEIKKKLRGIT